MAKKKTKQTKEELREEIINFFTHMNLEGGLAEYYTNYSSPQSISESFLTPEFKILACHLADTHQQLEAEMKKILKAHGIDEEEVTA